MQWLFCALLIATGLTPVHDGSSSRHSEVKPMRTFRVRDFGAVPDGRSDATEAIRATIREALQAGRGSEVVLDAGTYRVHGERPGGYCFSLVEAKGITVRGAGPQTRLVVTSPDAGLLLAMRSSQVALRDFAVDYDPVPFCQGLIRGVSAEEGWFDLEVSPGYPTPEAPNFVHAMEPYGKWGMIIDPATRRIRSGTIDHFMTPRWEHRAGRVWRFYTSGEHYRYGLRDMRVGDSYVHLARGYGSAVLAQFCDGVRIEGVTIYASPGLAVGLVGNAGSIVVRNVEVRFPPGSDRLLTTNADGVHCQQNRSGPILEGCYFEGMADDAINIYAPPNVLLEKLSDAEWLVTAGCAVRPGDRLQVLDPRSGRIRGTVRAREVAAHPRGLKLLLARGISSAQAGTDHRNADTLYNLDACGAGFRILRNRMHGNRRYGCLLRAHSGIVEGNTFTDTTGAGVVVVNEPDWPEGPVPGNIVIRRNRFVRGGTCRGYADGEHGQVVVRGSRIGFGLAEQPIVQGIRVEENVFEEYLGSAFAAGAVDGLVFRGNKLLGGQTPTLRTGPIIEVVRSRGVIVEDNTVRDRRQSITCVIRVAADVAKGTGGIRIGAMRAEVPPAVKLVTDERR